MIDDPDAVGEFVGHVEEVSGKEDRHPRPAAGLELFLDDAGVLGIEPDHGLIDDDDLGLVEQSRGEGETLAGAVTEILDALAAIGNQGKLLHQLRRALFCGSMIDLEQLCDEGHELDRGELVVELRHVGDVADTPFRLERIFPDVESADLRKSRGRFDEPREQLDRRCFPRRIRPEEGEKLAPLYREVEAVEGEEVAVAHGKVGYFNHSILGGTSRR